MKEAIQRFQQQHETIKREILQLLQKAFKDNERLIRDQLIKERDVEPEQFMEVHYKIGKFDENVTSLLHQLKGSDYRRAIAEVVLKDFNTECVTLRQNIKDAKELYITNLVGTEIDRTKV